MGRRWLTLACSVVLIPAVSQAKDAELCVFDPSGSQGDVYRMAKGLQVAALKWKTSLKLKPYTDEATAAADFQAKQCDLAMLTGTRARSFVKFTGTMEAMGALPTYRNLKSVLTLLAKPAAAKLVRNDKYETVAVFPGGAVHLFVRDRTIQTAEDLAGRKVATLDFDEASIFMVKRVGAAMVPADVGTFAGMFNNGSVDAAYAPALAYQPLELHKGIGDKGGVIDFPLAQVTFQVLAHRDAALPEDFGVQARKYALSVFDASVTLIGKAEAQIPKELWIKAGVKDQERYLTLMRDVRVALRDQKDLYDGSMLKLMRRVRCKEKPAQAECALKVE